MKQLSIVPSIHEFVSFKEFAESFKLNKDDLIFAGNGNYERFVKKLDLPCNILLRGTYGKEEPTDIMADAVLADASRLNYRRVIAIGGGSTIDIAKLLVFENVQSVDELFGTKLPEKKKKLVIIPTTCGSGSEVTSVSIINRTRIGTKMGLADPALYADHAVLIPEFVDSLPYHVFAAGSIDALIHAVESYLSPRATCYTEMFSATAISRILAGYTDIARYGHNIWTENSRSYLIASNYAGIAFGNAGCGAVHAASYAFGGKYHVAHGESNYQFFTDVLKLYLSKKPEGKMQKLIQMFDQILQAPEQEKQFTPGLSGLEELLEAVLERKPMSAYGAAAEDIQNFAASTVKNQQRLLQNNYVPLTEEEIRSIYAARL